MPHCAPHELFILGGLILVVALSCLSIGFVWGMDTERGRSR